MIDKKFSISIFFFEIVIEGKLFLIQILIGFISFITGVIGIITGRRREFCPNDN